ncbi:MAG: hypothetical protein WEG56_00205 [Chloroflexota bacterium]
MRTLRIHPRSAIADPELARQATLDLPGTVPTRRARARNVVARSLVARSVVARSLASLRGPAEPDQVIVLTLVPVHARRR